MKIIQDIWILEKDSGIVLYHRGFEEEMDTQLVGGLMSALNSFAEELTKEKLTSFDLTNKRFTLKAKDNLLFVVNSSPKVKNIKIYHELDQIIEIFFETYPKVVLENWDGEIGLFSDFESKIEDSLEETIDKFKKAFW